MEQNRLTSEQECGMLEHILPWVLPEYVYKDLLVPPAVQHGKVIGAAETKAREQTG